MKPASGPTVPTWLVIILMTSFIVFLVQKILWLVVPGLLALVLYYCLQPLVQTLVQAGLRHHDAVKVVAALLFLATVLALLGLLTLASSRAAAWQETLTYYEQGGLEFLARTEDALAEKLPLLRKAGLLPSSPTNLDAVAERVAQRYLGVVLLQVFHWLPSLLLVPYLAYFVLRDGNRLKKEIIRSVPNAFFEKSLLLFNRVDSNLQSFFIGLMKLTFLDTVCLATGLWLLGISFPVVLGLVAAVLAWLPYVGSVVGCVLVVCVAATDFPKEPVTIYGCMVLFLCVRILDDFVFLPMTIGRGLRIHPVLSVLMLFLGAAVAGPTGLVLVLPVLGVVAVIIETLAQIVADHRLRSRFRQAQKLKTLVAGLGV